MSRSSKRAVIALAAGLALLVTFAAGTGLAAKPRTTVVLGGSGETPNPSCPGLPCQAIGSVTGFQVSTTQTSLPFNVNRSGKVTAWTLTLAQPTNSQRSFFNGFFGTPPEARLAILRRVPGTSPPRYNLRSPGLGPRAQPLLRPDGQVRRLAEGRKGRHRRPHDPHLGTGLRAEPAGQERLAGEPRTGQVHQHHRRPPGPAAGDGRQASDLRLPLQHRASAVYGNRGRGD